MNQPTGVENKKSQRPSVPVRSALALAIAGACGLGNAPVLAQQAEQSEASGLDEIVVTARFREEKLQETPIAITATRCTMHSGQGNISMCFSTYTA